MYVKLVFLFFSSRRRHTRCSLVTGVQTCALPIFDPRVLDLAPASAHRISVAKQRARHTVPQDAINALIVAHVKVGSIVVRLKGGDPFIFGRGGEEVEAVRAAGLPVEVIPSVSAALGCAAEAMLPLTHRDYSSAVSFVAGQERQSCRERVCQ